MPPRRRIWQRPAHLPETDNASSGALEVVRDVAHALLRAERADEAFQFAIDRTCPAAGAALGSVFVVDGASELMHLVAAHAWPEKWRPWLGEMKVRVGFGPSGEAVSERRAIEVPDVFADPGLEDWQEVATELGFRALVALPLNTPAGILGAAAFYFAAPGTQPAPVLHLLRTVADLMAAIADKDAMRLRLRHAEAALDDQRTPSAARSGDDDNQATTG